MLDKPRLRPIEAFPVQQQDGKTLIYLKDPANFATPLGISPVGYFVLAQFDGHHSFTDIQEAYSKQFGTLLMSEELARLRSWAQGRARPASDVVAPVANEARRKIEI